MMSDPESVTERHATDSKMEIAGELSVETAPPEVMFHVELKGLQSLLEAILLPTRDHGILNRASDPRNQGECEQLLSLDGKLHKVMVAVSETRCHIRSTRCSVTSEAWTDISWEEPCAQQRRIAFEVQYAKLARLAFNSKILINRDNNSNRRSGLARTPTVRICFRRSENVISIQYAMAASDGSPLTDPAIYFLPVNPVESPSLEGFPEAPPALEGNFIPKRLVDALNKVREAMTTTETDQNSKWVVAEPQRTFAAKSSMAIRYEAHDPIVPHAFALTVEDAKVLASALRHAPSNCRIEQGEDLMTVEARDFRCSFPWSSRTIPGQADFWECGTADCPYEASREDLIYALLACQAAVGGRECGARDKEIELVVADYSDVASKRSNGVIPAWMLDQASPGPTERNSELARNRKVLLTGVRGAAANEVGIVLTVLGEHEDGVAPLHVRVPLSPLLQGILQCRAERIQLVFRKAQVLLVAHEAEGTLRIVIAGAQ